MNLTPDQLIELENETILLCQEMIRIPSVNYGEGKGDEKAMAEYVAAKLSEVGITSELIETTLLYCSKSGLKFSMLWSDSIDCPLAFALCTSS